MIIPEGAGIRLTEITLQRQAMSLLLMAYRVSGDQLSA